MACVPVGYEFRPTNEQLVRYYLYNKATKQPLPHDSIIKECDLYGDKEPWEIWEMFGGEVLEEEEEVDMYFFTKLKKKSVNGSRIDRKVGSGTWKGSTKGTEVFACKTRKCIGMKRNFFFENKKSEHDRGWIMSEYSLYGILLNQQTESNDFVICRIRKNETEEKKAKKKKRLRELGISIDDESNERQKKKAKSLGELNVITSYAESSNRDEFKATRQMKQALAAAGTNHIGVEVAKSDGNSTMDIKLQEHQGQGDIIVDFTDDDDFPELGISINELDNLLFTDNSNSEDYIIPLASEPSYEYAVQPSLETELEGFNAKEHMSIASWSPPLTSTSGTAPQSSLEIDYTGFDETKMLGSNAYMLSETNYGDVNQTSWAEWFAEELMGNQQQPVVEREINMLPNAHYRENWVRKTPQSLAAN